MLAEIISDNFNATPAQNQPIFRTDVDYDALIAKRDEIVKNWQALKIEDRINFKDQADFEKNLTRPT